MLCVMEIYGDIYIYISHIFILNPEPRIAALVTVVTPLLAQAQLQTKHEIPVFSQVSTVQEALSGPLLSQLRDP